ncbi:MAG: VCBS repeat-containing protein, partial [Gemmatimonadetes bacterium]|nr:VCBS repeat-containing protein [Gemmatimonadota bacterium]
LDIVATSWGLDDPLRYFRNQGDGTFTERTAAAGLTGLVGGLNAVQTDFDNDGFADVLVLRGGWFGADGLHPNSLLRNQGDGTFADVTEAAGLLTLHPTQTALLGRLRQRRWLDPVRGQRVLRPRAASLRVIPQPRRRNLRRRRSGSRLGRRGLRQRGGLGRH